MEYVVIALSSLLLLISPSLEATAGTPPGAVVAQAESVEGAPMGDEPVTGGPVADPAIEGDAVEGGSVEDAPIGGAPVYGEPDADPALQGAPVEGGSVEEDGPIGGDPLE